MCVCVFAIHGRGVWSPILVLGENWTPPFSSCVFMSSHIMVFACSCVYLWVHARFSHALSLCVDARVQGNCRALSNRERCFSKGCQNEFVTQSVNLRRKGTVERETFPRHPQSVRLIKSHGWSESWETEPECAEGTCYDSKETKKLQHVSINDSSTAHVPTCTWPLRPRAGTLHTSVHPIITTSNASSDRKQVRAILKFTKCNMTGQL